jgi:hypothetical protein
LPQDWLASRSADQFQIQKSDHNYNTTSGRDSQNSKGNTYIVGRANSSISQFEVFREVFSKPTIDKYLNLKLID